MLTLITLCLAIYTSVHAFEKCHKSSSCICEDGLIVACHVTIDKNWLQRLHLRDITQTKFSDKFNLSNLAAVKGKEDEKQGIIFENGHSPIKNYSQFIHYMDKCNATLKFASFLGIGIGQEDSEGLLELLEWASPHLEGLIFHDYQPKEELVLDLSRIHFANLAHLTIEHNNLKFRVVLPNMLQLSQEPIPNYAVLYNYHKSYPQLEKYAEWLPIFPILKFQDVKFDNRNFSIYINRNVNKQALQWSPQGKLQCALPTIISSPYPVNHWYDDVVVKIGPQGRCPTILTKDMLLHGGSVNLLCLPETIQQIEYGALSTRNDMKAFAIGRFQEKWTVDWTHGCDNVVSFTALSGGKTQRDNWLNARCDKLHWFLCELCFMHFFGLHKTNDGVEVMCQKKVWIPVSMMRNCYWADPETLSDHDMNNFPLLGAHVDPETKSNCPPSNYWDLFERKAADVQAEKTISNSACNCTCE